MDTFRNCMRILLTVFLLGISVTANEFNAPLGVDLIIVKAGSQDVSYPAIWGDIIVWKGADNEVYDISQEELIPMPGLQIEGVPAIWQNIVVWEGSKNYYDLNAQKLVAIDPFVTIGLNPAIHSHRIVWDNSIGYYDLEQDFMTYVNGLYVGADPDIFEDKIVWSGSRGYLDIRLKQMVQPRGLEVGLYPAIQGQKITWSYLKGGYYDLDLETYGHERILTGRYLDIFADRVIWFRGPDRFSGPAVVWDPICGAKVMSRNIDRVNRVQIYQDIVVWDQNAKSYGEGKIYMARVPGCCGDAAHPYPQGDLNHNCRVDFSDLALLASHWLEETSVDVPPTLQVTVETDKTVYSLSDDEVMNISVTAVNPSTETIVMRFPSSNQVTFYFDGLYEAPAWVTTAETEKVLSPGASCTWQLLWELVYDPQIKLYPLTPGNHTIIGAVVGYAESETVEFEVTD